MSRPVFVLFVAILAIGADLPAHAAETIARKRDKPISGDVTGVSKTEVTLKVRGVRDETVTIPANEIQSISWSGEPPDANLARGDEAAGRFQRALDGYEKSLAGFKSPNPLARVDFEFAIIRTLAKLAQTNSDKIDDAIRRLEEFRSKHADHYRNYEALDLLGRLYSAKKDWPKAQQAYDSLAKAPWKESQMSAKVAIGRLLVADDKPDEARAAFDSVISMPAEGAQAESLKLEASLGKGSVLLAQKRFDEARTLLQEVVDKSDPDDAPVNAEAYVRLGDCLREQGQDKDAVLAYLHVEILYPSEKAQQAEALFQLSRLWDKVGQKGRAVEARERLAGDEFKGSEWARQLKSRGGE